MTEETRLKQVHDDLEKLRRDFAVMSNDLKHMNSNVEKLERLIQANYITQAEFKPIRLIVYGMTGLILTGVVGALLALVIQ